jgi:peptide deformylase
MTILRILDYPDPRLKICAPAVENINDPGVQKTIDDMLETLANTPHCGGLAATQLDIAEPKRIFVFYDFDEADSAKVAVATVAINPEILATEGEIYEEEGCMSVYPDAIQAKVIRPEKTQMRALNRYGEMIEYIRSGYLAKNFMHEVDHLNGKLYIDYLKPLKRSLIDDKIIKKQRALAKKMKR